MGIISGITWVFVIIIIFILGLIAALGVGIAWLACGKVGKLNKPAWCGWRPGTDGNTVPTASPPVPTASPPVPTASPTSTKSSFKLTNDWTGRDIYNDLTSANPQQWEFVTYEDPTHGNVNYGAHVDLLSVIDKGDKLKIMMGDYNEESGNRDSIRINTQETFDNGLYILRLEHIPAGNSVWPAFWMTSDVAVSSEPGVAKWACGGEIDIIEGVNSTETANNQNKTSLHISPPNDDPTNVCTQTNNGVNGTCGFPQGTGGGTCGCDGNSQCPYEGCGLDYDSQVSFGYGFNQNEGGYFACRIQDTSKVKVWFFTHNDAPYNIDSNNPNLEDWDSAATQVVEFDACAKDQFLNLQIIFNTTLCGDWAGGVLNNCSSYLPDDANYVEAYWVINWLKTFEEN
jgi:hypothetical protein